MRKIASLLSVLMFVCALAFGQTRTVSGTVRDANGNPIPFATISVVGTKAATQADANGNFTVTNVANDARLHITATGFAAQTVAASGNLSSVALVRSEGQLSEVVVTALGVRRQAKELGYSTARVNTAELTQARPTNLATGLAAKVSGVDIRLADNSINPQVKITFRGSRSILG